jgi:hypothetical protein
VFVLVCVCVCLRVRVCVLCVVRASVGDGARVGARSASPTARAIGSPSAKRPPAETPQQSHLLEGGRGNQKNAALQ